MRMHRHCLYLSKILCIERQGPPILEWTRFADSSWCFAYVILIWRLWDHVVPSWQALCFDNVSGLWSSFVYIRVPFAWTFSSTSKLVQTYEERITQWVGTWGYQCSTLSYYPLYHGNCCVIQLWIKIRLTTRLAIIIVCMATVTTEF